MKNWRFYALVFFVFLCFAAIIFRLFSLQVLNHSSYEAKAVGQQQTFQTVYPKRGEIFMKDRYSEGDSLSSLFPAAINKDFYKVFAVPKEIQEKEESVELLSPLLGIDKATLKERIFKIDDPYEPLENKVDDKTAQEIKELDLKGIYLETETWRYFPANDLACHLLGFVRQNEGEKEEGQYGVEEFYEKELAGKTGLAKVGKDSKGQLISVDKEIIQEAEDGADLILTVDPNIQSFIEDKLKKTAEYWQAAGGTVILMDVRTGAIRALANWPNFNPNNYNEVKNINLFSNPATQALYEPGSVFKPITMAAALDQGVITPQTTYEDKGSVKVGDRVIENALPGVEGTQTMIQVLEKSLNTGAVFVQQKLGKEKFKNYVEKFGFAEKTGIDLKGEAKGNLSNLEKKGDVEYATASFGQGIAVTPLELISAFAAIANNGRLMKPYLVEKIIDNKDNKKTTQPEEIRQVISSDTASRLTAMLVSVVENGHAKRAGVPGYSVAAKTGTAQIPDFKSGGYSDETIHTLAGFFPAFDARFVLLVKLEKPKGVRFAESTVAPVFSEIAKYVLDYYEIPPSK